MIIWAVCVCDAFSLIEFNDVLPASKKVGGEISSFGIALMVKGVKSGACKSASHQLFKDRAKNRVDDLQGIFSDLQSARKESRTIDVAVLEEQVHQMLREWKAELSDPTPASSLQQVIDHFVKWILICSISLWFRIASR